MGADPLEREALVVTARAIAISRQIGTDGDAIGRTVASALDFGCYDHEVLERAAHDVGVTPEAIGEAERKHSLLERVLENLALDATVPVAEMKLGRPYPQPLTSLVTSDDYRRLLENVVPDLAGQGKCVIVGHGATVLLDALGVLVTGSPEVRARRVAKDSGMASGDAARVVADTDRERLDYFHSFYDRDWLAPGTYGLCINSDVFDAESAAALVLEAARRL